jgi:glycosyltransferase involved in cell wall biosynthesis
VIAAVTRAMAALLVRACTRAYVSVPGWLDLLKSLGGARVPTTWLPVPTTLPTDPPADLVAATRPGAPTVGHFGTYGPLITLLLGPALGEILDRRPDVRVSLIGANGDRWRGEFLRTRPNDAPRVTATGERPTPELAARLRACDVVVQPYPDGASSRRTTFTAALANGVPVVTTAGHLTDPLVAAAPVTFAPADRLAAAVLDLLDAPDRRRELAEAGRRYYEQHFAAGRTVAALLADPVRPGARR